MVIGIRRANGEDFLPPPGAARILAGDILFAFGKSAAVNEGIGERH
jgi:Trk K+ transport system NAD-binding subunit